MAVTLTINPNTGMAEGGQARASLEREIQCDAGNGPAGEGQGRPPSTGERRERQPTPFPRKWGTDLRTQQKPGLLISRFDPRGTLKMCHLFTEVSPDVSDKAI